VGAHACSEVSGLKAWSADAANGDQCAEVIEKAHGIAVHIVWHPGNRSTGARQSALANRCGARSSPTALSFKPYAGS
jgi:hypothetical protein